MKVSKIRSKVASKVAKCKAKVAERTGEAVDEAKKAAKCVALLFALAVVVSGCSTTGQQPARSQTMNNDFSKCVVVVASKATVTADGAKVTAEGGELPSVDLFTQAQANDGSETISPHASPTNTTDVDAALDVPVNKMNSGTSAAGGAAEKLLGAGADWLSSKIGTGGAGSTATANANAATTTTTATDCKDGSCTDTGGDCKDGSCSLK